MRLFLCAFSLGSLFIINNALADGRCKTDDPFPYTAPYDMETCPQDIQDWMDRANSCNHFSGEEATDAERKKELAQNLEELKCSDLFCDYDDLFMKYEGDIVYTGVLTGYAEVLYGNTDIIICDRKKP